MVEQLVCTKEEQFLLEAALSYAKKEGVSLTKMSWALSTVMNRSDNSIYYRLKSLERGEVVSVLPENVDMYEVGDSGDLLEQRIGEIVKVQVVSIKTYGVVCSVIGTTRTLLLHLSEVADAFIDDIGKYVGIGDMFSAMLIVNPKGQLGLSARRVKPLEAKKHDDDYLDFDDSLEEDYEDA